MPCRRMDDKLIEVLARPQGRDMLVFHIEHLADIPAG